MAVGVVPGCGVAGPLGAIAAAVWETAAPVEETALAATSARGCTAEVVAVPVAAAESATPSGTVATSPVVERTVDRRVAAIGCGRGWPIPVPDPIPPDGNTGLGRPGTGPAMIVPPVVGPETGKLPRPDEAATP